MLTTSQSEGDIRRALEAGASAYLLKTTPSRELLAAIRSVRAGRKYVPAYIAQRLTKHLGSEDLTPSELQVLRHIRDGFSNRQIADMLDIAEATINFHIRNCVGKLNANDRAHAVIVALRRGLIEL
jgi:DNA-binding NarL/FixJ family response regulator